MRNKQDERYRVPSNLAWLARPRARDRHKSERHASLPPDRNKLSCMPTTSPSSDIGYRTLIPIEESAPRKYISIVDLVLVYLSSSGPAGSVAAVWCENALSYRRMRHAEGVEEENRRTGCRLASTDVIDVPSHMLRLATTLRSS
ncbi:hypothetical protein EVAR_100173_1 [Eumeta japonica]|uniref:Uncharacterized protein n=1 Tax=Eumeta variegata TaxID=151549 RepID=A0A4C2A5P8_EUMVA|nr:hypothetical protein EVAR_100173_1 [Eumeta japonica]